MNIGTDASDAFLLTLRRAYLNQMAKQFQFPQKAEILDEDGEYLHFCNTLHIHANS